jgi:ATP-dependent Clp protease ATP-binding subunit ClpC
LIEKDAALERRFQTVMIEAPTAEEAVQILQGLRLKYEAHHKAKLTEEALEAAVCLSGRYITGRSLPDKAIDVMDEACARARINSMAQPPDVEEIGKQISALNPRLLIPSACGSPRRSARSGDLHEHARNAII